MGRQESGRMGGIMRKKRVRPIKKQKGLNNHFFLFLFLVGAIFIGIFYIWQQQHLVDQKINSADSGLKLDNPERGWYVIKGYQTESGENQEDILSEFENVCKQIRKDKDRLIQYQILIQKPASKNAEILEEDLDTIQKEFALIKQYGLQTIVRPVYDWDGEKGKEPSKFQTILTHIKQLSVIFSEYRDTILCVEAGLLGPNGEWHSSSYLNIENMRTIVKTYLIATPKTMQISVRRPEFYREIFKTKKPVDAMTARNGEDESRVGFYNDGYLGSASDLGTYTLWSRQKELNFQSEHNQFLYFGGEATMITLYGQLFNAIWDMEQTHCTYLNREHYLPLKELWKETLYKGNRASDPAYKNKTGYQYIQDHLGYRYVLQVSKIQRGVWRGNSFQGEFTVWNAGFGNMIKPKDVRLILAKDQEQIEIPLKFDVRTWKRGLTTENYTIPIPEGTKQGTWNVYLSIKSGETPIQWGNESGYSSSVGGMKLGVIHIY